MVRDLKNSVLKSQWTNDPNNTFESYFIDRGNRTDEYLCSIPSGLIDSIEEKELTSSLEQVDAVNDARLLATAIDIIEKSFPTDECVFAYDLRGLYWTYAYCFADKVIQYHEAVPPAERRKRHLAANPNQVYLLGRFTDATSNSIKIGNQATQKHKEKYVTQGKSTFTLGDDIASPFHHRSTHQVVQQQMQPGSYCEEINGQRSVEIIYKCDPDAHGFSQPQIIDVPELTTCLYKMVIHVPDLCSLEQFAPLRSIRDSLVELACQLVDEERAGEEEEPPRPFESYTSNVRLRDHDNFPVRGDNKISVDEHSLMSLGYGFYLAKSKVGYTSTSSFYNNRNIVIHNGFADLLEDLGNQIGRTLYNAVGRTLLAPYFEENDQKRLSWSDSFTIWLEVYDFFGNFKALIRTVRDGSNTKKSLLLQVIDPVTMIDIDGDSPEDLAFDLPEYEAPHNLWNYQYFSRGEVGQRKQKAINNPGVKTVTEKEVVTVTVPSQDEEQAATEGAEHLVELSDEQDPMPLYINEENIKEIIGNPEDGAVDIVVDVDGAEETYRVDLQ